MTEENPLQIAAANPEWVEEQYQRYLHQPAGLSREWVAFFDRMEEESTEAIPTRTFAPVAASLTKEPCRIQTLIDRYRTYGHLAVAMNPVALHETVFPQELSLEACGFTESELTQEFPTGGLLKESHAPLLKIIETLKHDYCADIGYEFKGFTDSDIEKFLEQEIEHAHALASLSLDQRLRVLQLLSKAELFESFIHMKFPGQKRFSLEGAETLIPMMTELLEESARYGCEELVIGMAHRGRLNVLANIMNKSYVDIFSEFDEGYFPDSFEGTGDVKYHKGFLSDVVTVAGHPVKVTLMPNPSHLESVNAVVEGQVKGSQIKRSDVRQDRVVPLLVHGDAAISGQGVVYETFQLSKLPNYSTGGTLHVVVNNQIGFTTSPEDSRSTYYCTDIAKTFGLPVFHVNAENPEACIRAAYLAAAVRHKFHIDVIIELNCYRKYGHNESDEPFFTQPILYKKIRSKKSIRELYGEKLIELGVVEKYMVESMEEEFKKALAKAQASALSTPKKGVVETSKPAVSEKLVTSLPLKILRELAEKFSEMPSGFHPHPKLEQLFKARLGMVIQQTIPIDWGMAEFLALAANIHDGFPIRLAGQDVGRGTFSHRHALWVDQETGESYYPLSHLAKGQVRADVINSTLSEFAALGFEYGYSLGYPETMVIWEAQFGDFANGGQVIIDQYIAAAEQKWAQKSDLTMLLPHGYEGQGPEHSSARMERFLTLAGHDNMAICNPSTPAQFFHLLRRQALTSVRKPLVVFTPKALLRLPECVSSLNEFVEGSFLSVLIDQKALNASHLLFCSGKIYYELLKLREKEKLEDFALIRIEELYPFPQEMLKTALSQYKKASHFTWVQEEPANMGAWSYIHPLLEELLPKGAKLHYNGRETSAAPASGSYVLHKKELTEIYEAIKTAPKKESIEIHHFHRA
jgi:2-oxoglutarate dehydrogenase E1 component